MIKHIAHQIQTLETEDIDKISKVIGIKFAEKGLLALLNVGWIDKQNRFLYDQKEQILPESKISTFNDYSIRPYVEACHKNPWEFHVSQTLFDTIRGERQLKIPAGIGIRKKNGHFLGIVCVGIPANDLRDAIDKKLKGIKSPLKYIVLEEKQNIEVIFQNIDNKNDKNTAGHFNYLKNSVAGILEKPIIFKDISFYNFEKKECYGHSYYILSGLERSAYVRILFEKICPILITLLFSFLIMIVCLFFGFRKTQEISNE